MGFTRRDALRVTIGGGVLAALSPTLVACGSSQAKGQSTGASLTNLPLQLSWLNGAEWGGTYIARERGYHRAAGLNVEISPGGPQVSVEPRLATGKAVVGMTYGYGAASANANGAGIRIIGAHFQKSPNGIASLASAPITDPHQLVGKKLGVSASSVASMKAFLEHAGVDPSKVKFVPVQDDLSPLANHQVDAFGAYLTDTAKLNAKGIKTNFMFRSDFGYGDMPDVYGVTTKTLATHRAEIVSFLRAELRGWQDFVKDPAYGARLAVQKYGQGLGLDLAEQTVEARLYGTLVTGGDPTFTNLFQISKATKQQVVASVTAAGIKTTEAELFDDSVLNEARGGHG
ncbi:MAG: ABC transporter substrate-binding protein [Frankia sp.]